MSMKKGFETLEGLVSLFKRWLIIDTHEFDDICCASEKDLLSFANKRDFKLLMLELGSRGFAKELRCELLSNEFGITLRLEYLCFPFTICSFSFCFNLFSKRIGFSVLDDKEST